MVIPIERSWKVQRYQQKEEEVQGKQKGQSKETCFKKMIQTLIYLSNEIPFIQSFSEFS